MVRIRKSTKEPNITSNEVNEDKNSKTLFNCIERMETWGTSRKMI